MSVEGINGNVQQYTIRAKREAQSANQSAESQQAIQNQNVGNEPRAAEIDSYDKDSPAGIKAEGVYSVSHDESGSLRIDYSPVHEESEKSQADSESESSKSNGRLKTEQPKSSGTSQSESSTSSDDELEELQRQKNELQQQLNREQDENVKAQLRLQLQNIEAQIMQLKLN